MKGKESEKGKWSSYSRDERRRLETAGQNGGGLMVWKKKSPRAKKGGLEG